ncbi:MAG: bifunctional riboflavin kinase/FAD synthetase [Flavobacteriales bacterium]
MKIHTDFTLFSQAKNTVVTIGTFDGVHKGHQHLLSRVCEMAKEIGGESVLLTFHPHPRMVLYPDDHGLHLMNTPEEKAHYIAQTGMGHLVVYPFTHELSRLSAFEYVRDLLVNGLKTHTVVVGYDHRFGKNREGDHNTMLELAEVFGFHVEQVAPQTVDEVNISSTKIRQALMAGHVSEATKYLGKNYSVTGTVVHGDKVGRQLGYPTANIECGYKYKLIPATGVYAVHVVLDGERLNGVMNIGVRPTTHSNSLVVTEVYIMNFDRDIYGKQLTVEFVERLREEKKFGSIDELKQAIADDIATSGKLF